MMKVKLHRTGKTPELEDFVNRMNIGEPFDYTAPFIFIAKIDNNLFNLSLHETVESTIST